MKNSRTIETNSKGITLVALIISIIVLLILATVSINLVMNNGLLDKAKSAVDKYSEGEIRERIMLAVTNARMKNISLLDRTTLDNELKSEFGEGNYELLSVGEGFLISVNNVEYLVDKDGKVNDGNKVEESNIEYAGDLSKGGQYDGTTEETAYRITCIEDLVEWSNNPGNYSIKNIKLENTIDFNSTASYKNARSKTTDINGNGKIEELITELTTEKGFKPIGNFSGTFDGQNNEIKNIYENKTGNAGLFSFACSTTIKNLSISGKIQGSGKVGGFIADCGANYWVKMENCNNMAEIHTTGEYAGGLIGYVHGSATPRHFYNCSNIGNITSNNYSGGILGGNDNAGFMFINLYNNGIITGLRAGGLIGSCNGSSKIENVYNTGNVVSKSEINASGIASWIRGTPNLDKAYYLNSTLIAQALYGWGWSYNYKGRGISTYEYMNSQEFVNELNTYVDTYNEEHKNDEDFIALRRWKYNAGNYPTFE